MLITLHQLVVVDLGTASWEVAALVYYSSFRFINKYFTLYADLSYTDVKYQYV